MQENKISHAGEPSGTNLERKMGAPHRILVVEDEIFFRRLITDGLSRAGYQVDAAHDGAAAWDILQFRNYDLMVTDNRMPKLSGVDLLKRLSAAQMAVPVIMATTESPKDEFTRHPGIRPAAMLVKPYTVEDLLEEVEKIFRDADGAADGTTPLLHLKVKDGNRSQGREPDVRAPQLPTNSRRILVVDEDTDIRLMYSDVLAGPDCSVDEAEDGDVGWEALQASNYNLLITEHDLPKLTGVELIRKVRAARMDLPVVMAAGCLPTYQLARNPSLQLAATLLKPFSAEALLFMVSKVLRTTDVSRE